jgi:hypothetical protein
MWDILTTVFWLAAMGLAVTGLYVRSGDIASRFDGGTARNV